MDRDKCRMIRDVLNEELQACAEKLGLVISIGNATYTDTNVTFKVECAEISEDGTVMNKEASDFKSGAYLYGLEPEDFGREFESNGKVFKIVGLKARSRKYPVIGEDVQGKRFKFPETVVKRGFQLLDLSA